MKTVYIDLVKEGKNLTDLLKFQVLSRQLSHENGFSFVFRIVLLKKICWVFKMVFPFQVYYINSWMITENWFHLTI